jgi:hypothetical protein
METLLSIALVVGVALAAFWSYKVGRQRGRNEQYVDDIIAAANRDRARRDRRGRFARVGGGK